MDTSDYTVDQPERVAGILRSMNHRQTLVSIRLETNGPLYTSALIRLDPDTRELFLDELIPESAHQLMTPGQSLWVFASLRGVAVHFRSHITRILVEDQGALYVCPYPETLRHLQRRENFRVHIPLSRRPELSLQGAQWEKPVPRHSEWNRVSV